MEEEHIYLTAAGLKRIKKRYQTLCRRREEDNKEKNGDKDLELSTDERLLQEEIQREEFILSHYQLIHRPQGEERKKVNLGAKVIVEIDRRFQKFTIVDFPEANPDQGRISRSSPLAKALFGGKVGDEILVNIKPPQRVRIKKIKY